MYKRIARYYDLLGWGEFHDVAFPRLKPLLVQYDVESYLDLACGTGTLSFSVAKLGIEVVGLDKSREMLRMAEDAQRLFRRKNRPEFLLRDMTRFNLKRRFDAVGCFFDAANHILTEEGFRGLCICAARHLQQGGFFIFDVNTVIGMRKWDAVLFSRKGKHALLMKGEYDRSTRLAEVSIAGFVQLGPNKRDDFKETFYERAYPHAYIIRSLRQAGFGRIVATPDRRDRTLRTAHRVFYTAFRR